MEEGVTEIEIAGSGTKNHRRVNTTINATKKASKTSPIPQMGKLAAEEGMIIAHHLSQRQTIPQQR
ncbi:MULTISPECIES: hypothetical protein [unclassified Streptomyces]|uniref:hypothetical protein n=1 Tax=unclassified Streptomyces TaxID=2593676 RepID=UPI002E789571|nr:hypothetical protein [Streptomyces sp. JV176]MEE1801407.1 hypothetical protein [Streptomyces sp. JV176]